VARSVKRPTLDLSPGLGLRVIELKAHARHGAYLKKKKKERNGISQKCNRSGRNRTYYQPNMFNLEKLFPSI